MRAESVARVIILGAVGLLVFSAAGFAGAEFKGLRFDCGTAASPVMAGYQRLTPDDTYAEEKGYGWVGNKPEGADFEDLSEIRKDKKFGGLGWDEYIRSNFTDLNRDAVASASDLVFRADVPNGTYRVDVMVGDMTRALGSIDVTVNGQLVASQITAWTPGGYRSLQARPIGWWSHVRHTVEVKDGQILITLAKNQSYYDQQMAEQSTWTNPYRTWWAYAPEKQPAYFHIGWPFVRNSIMAIEILPDVPPPIVGKDDKFSLSRPVASPGLSKAIASFNEGRYLDALKSLDAITEPDAEPAKAVLKLWLAGRLEVEAEESLVPEAIETLRNHVASHPAENEVAELLLDAEAFRKALTLHLTRGELGKNHGIENMKSVGWWWLIKEGSPLYYKSQLYIARAAHMLVPYVPTLGTEAEILKRLDKKFPDNRFVKYLLHWTWEPYGDGTHRNDWYMVDYESKVKDAPAWVQQTYPAWAGLVDWAEWVIRFKQYPDGSIGGGLTDDVEMVAALGYMGYTSRGISELAVQGARNLCEGVWKYSDIDDEVGFFMYFGDAEHTAEPTGDMLGMMVQIDYGSPIWIERSMKTGKLIRDFWTAYDNHGFRHFRSNHFSATQLGSGYQMDDSWIDYRAVKPAGAVLWYNQNPATAKLFIEMADGWLAAAVSTDRGKPKGVIPTGVSFPDGLIWRH